MVIGDVGSSPTPRIQNISASSIGPPFGLHLADDSVTRRARRDANLAYATLRARGAGALLPDNLATVGPLTQGVYSFATGNPYLPAGEVLTLDGGGVFVFNVDHTLTTSVFSNVLGTADPCNIYWRVGGSAALNGAMLRGTVIAAGNITIGPASRLAGRALAGAVTDGEVTIGSGSAIVDCAVFTLVPWSPAWWQVSLFSIALGYISFVVARAKIRSLPEW